MDAIGKMKSYNKSKGVYCWYALIVFISLFDIFGRSPYIRKCSEGVRLYGSTESNLGVIEKNLIIHV